MSASSLGKPFVDVDEQRTQPYPHRYVHGGFEGSHTRFSFYFPPKELYKGRFVQFLQGGSGGSEHALTAGLGAPGQEGPGSHAWFFDMAFNELGAYAVESNQGRFNTDGMNAGDPVVEYGASAESARFSRTLAEEMYGSAPKHGYVGGPSGGGMRSFACIEHASDIYDGTVPYVAVINIANQYSAFPRAVFALGDKINAVIDAVEPGGSGDPFAGLTNDQRDALASAYRAGWPRGAETQMYPIGVFGYAMHNAAENDPGYFKDFWSVTGYLGHDDPQALGGRLVETKARVNRVLHAKEVVRPAMMAAMAIDPEFPVGVTLDYPHPERLLMSALKFTSGAARGREVWVQGVNGENLTAFREHTPEAFTGVEPGDELTIDNKNWLAFTYYHRYGTGQTPQAREPGTRVLAEHSGFAVDGVPIYPQRPPLRDAVQVKAKFPGKMIMCQGTHDVNVWPTTVTPYITMLHNSLGKRYDDQIRVWWMENATHGHPAMMAPSFTPEKRAGVWMTRLIDYSPIIRQAFRDLVAWVEEEKPAPSSTNYKLNGDNGLVLANTAKARGGIQPVVSAKANGGSRAEVRAGEPVTFEGFGEAPPGSGTVVTAEWDFDGLGTWPHQHPADGSATAVSAKTTHTFTQPGTYFASFRVGAHRDGAKRRGAPIHNLARVRVVVR